jgi:putative aldouronate transport system permease protein
MPHFLSWISIVGLCYAFFSDYGPINDLLCIIFGQSRERVLYLAKQEFFVPLLLMLNLWQSTGWGSIIYLAAIAGLDPLLYEAAAIDGASRFQQVRYITLPGISTTAAIILILSVGGIFGSNFELVFGLQNAYINFETIDTVIFKHGIQQRGYSLATALGFSRGMIALVITIGANYMSKRVNDVAVF